MVHDWFAVRGLARCFLALCVVTGIGVGTPSVADQSDPRLPFLFEDLERADSPARAALIERQIWVIWGETSDPAAAALMSDGLAAMSAGNTTDALEIFDRLVVAAPDLAEGWNKRATIHYMLGNFDLSLEDIDRTIALEPRHFGALSGQGLVQLSLGNLGRALDAFEAALKIHPQMVGASVNAREIRKVLGNDI
ncbi:MAG: tetratricopeptide repeat protein [Pseudomonadota bacterium]